MTQDGISFNSVKNGVAHFSNWPLILTGQQGLDEDGGIINAVDIDWNSAVIPNGDLENGTSKTINTTGELLSLIDKMQEEIYVLSAA